MYEHDKTRLSSVYAIEAEDGRVYVGVTGLKLPRRMSLHRSSKRSAATALLSAPHEVKLLEASVGWHDRRAREDYWISKYRADGWAVVSLLNSEIRSLVDDEARMKKTNASITREARQANGRKAANYQYRCECGMTTGLLGLYSHQRATGHSGSTRT